ncbi:hypothetical protein [Streptomyces spectabilis]|uniref:Uncharacterized protein n=1 Tax=Streptomyces spectabilis TaxID=68270 RepID=A0A7W8B4B6_STRST|nr:hypothetical protein [Streptomyces spectabilis]MBB5109461.1 hypothetical protein [Streptomyces spectabilis]MCI3907808.1 hypothetical protein [Streptomyces spectabilis]GGV53456.1 hypothetical protein GCM10010245_84390 [Streptomyces spectabilis]
MSGTPDSDFSGLEGGEEQAAEEAIQEVVNWYNAQLLAERRAPVPDEERIEELKGGREAALADAVQLATADPEEAGRVAAVYAARLKALKES